MKTFQGPGLYELADGQIAFCESGGCVCPGNVTVNDRNRTLAEYAPDVFEMVVARAA